MRVVGWGAAGGGGQRGTCSCCFRARTVEPAAMDSEYLAKCHAFGFHNRFSVRNILLRVHAANSHLHDALPIPVRQHRVALQRRRYTYITAGRFTFVWGGVHLAAGRERKLVERPPSARAEFGGDGWRQRVVGVALTLKLRALFLMH